MAKSRFVWVETILWACATCVPSGEASSDARSRDDDCSTFPACGVRESLSERDLDCYSEFLAGEWKNDRTGAYLILPSIVRLGIGSEKVVLLAAVSQGSLGLLTFGFLSRSL